MLYRSVVESRKEIMCSGTLDVQRYTFNLDQTRMVDQSRVSASQNAVVRLTFVARCQVQTTIYVTEGLSYALLLTSYLTLSHLP